MIGTVRTMSTLDALSTQRRVAADLDMRLSKAATEASTGQKADIYQALGLRASEALVLRAGMARNEAFIASNEMLSSRLELTALTLRQTRETAHDPSSPANGNTGYLPHPAGPEGQPVATVGGYVMGIPANIAPERRAAAAEALIAFTSPEAQKLYILNGSRTAPRYSVGADPEVRRISPIFEAVDAMSLRDELQYWPRPPIPQIAEIIEICGQELHDMLRGILSPRDALRRAQSRAEDALK